MPRPKAHFCVLVKDHVTEKQLKVELVDLPFADGRRFRLRVNGKWAAKVPVASKTMVLKQVQRGSRFRTSARLRFQSSDVRYVSR